MCLPIIVGDRRNSLAAAAKEPRSATFTKTDMLVSRSMIINQWCFHNAQEASLSPDSNDLDRRDQRNAGEWQGEVRFNEIISLRPGKMHVADALDRRQARVDHQRRTPPQ